MNVIFYAASGSVQGEKLKRVINIIVPRDNVETLQTMPTLVQRLQQPLPDDVVFVFLVSDRRELQGLIECREWLRDSRLILVLPDEDMETVSRGHVLRPRFITYAESDFIDVSAVLGKMTGIGAVKYPSLSPAKGQESSEERRII